MYINTRCLSLHYIMLLMLEPLPSTQLRIIYQNHRELELLRHAKIPQNMLQGRQYERYWIIYPCKLIKGKVSYHGIIMYHSKRTGRLGRLPTLNTNASVNKNTAETKSFWCRSPIIQKAVWQGVRKIPGFCDLAWAHSSNTLIQSNLYCHALWGYNHYVCYCNRLCGYIYIYRST